MSAQESFPSYEQTHQMRIQLRDADLAHWSHHDIYTLNFYLLLVVAIVPWVIWWKIVDRKRIYEILTFGFLIGLVSTILDSLGTNMVFWGYKDQLFSVAPPLFPADITLMSVPFMLIYQRYRTFRSFLIACTLVALFYSFVGENLLEWLDIYELDTWKHIYSFPIYILLPLCCRWFTRKVHPPTVQMDPQG